MSVRAGKSALRAGVLVARKAQCGDELERESGEVLARILAWPPYIAAKTVMLYVGVRGEILTRELITHALFSDKRVALPVCGEGNVIHPVELGSPSDLVIRMYGIPEPRDASRMISKSEIDLVVVPGLMFDARGFRLGYGQGYYDRFLAGMDAVTLGMCQSGQFVRALPREAHDTRVGYVATPDGIWNCEGEL